MPYHMNGLGLGSLGMGGLDPMGSSMSYGPPSELETGRLKLTLSPSWRQKTEERTNHFHKAAAGYPRVTFRKDQVGICIWFKLHDYNY